MSGVALAGWSFANAYANVSRVRNPRQALRVSPNDPLAIAYAADRTLLAASDEAALRAVATRDALRSLDGTLLNPVAVRLVASRFATQPSRFLAVLNAAQALTRHDVATQLVLIETNVVQGNVAGALLGYDHILRRKPAMGETLFPILAGAARDPGIKPVLAARFAAGTPWVGSFIDWAVASDPNLGTLLPVIDAARPNGSGLSPGRKQGVVKRLAELGDYPSAITAYRRYLPPTGRPDDFSRASVYAPLDWEVQNGPGLDGAIDPKAKMFRFTVLGNGQGTLLRRLISVSPGRYRLDVDGAVTGPATVRVTGRATCATNGAVLGTARLRSGPPTDAVSVDVPSGCGFVWLTLDGMTRSDDAAEGHVSHFRLVPASPRSLANADRQAVSQDLP